MTFLIEKIKQHDWVEVLNFTQKLSDSERYETIEALKKLDIEADILKAFDNDLIGQARTDFYQNRRKVDACLQFALISCTRNYADIKKIDFERHSWIFNTLVQYLRFCPDYVPLIAFYTLFPPDYLDKIVKDATDAPFGCIRFKLLWKFYERGWVRFDEAVFVQQLFTLRNFDHDHFEDAQFLLDNPEFIERVFLKFYLYQIPVLDSIKAKSIDYKNGLSAKAATYWTEVFKILIEKKALNHEILLKNLLGSLLNSWKKPHLDWHARLIDLLEPTKQQLLTYQVPLFLVLGTNQPSIINFVMEHIKSISVEPDFDTKAFSDYFPLMLTQEKCGKSVLIGLEILDNFWAKLPLTTNDYREQLVIVLMQTDPKVQEKTATILLKYFDDSNLKAVVEPYSPYLKQRTKDLFSMQETAEIVDKMPILTQKKTYNEIIIPPNWDELFFHIGKCISTKSLPMIELFFEGLNQLQSDIPNDFAKQLKPYTKQLNSRFWDIETIRIFTRFINAWAEKRAFEPSSDGHKNLQFLQNKAEWLLLKLKNKDNLPFLSTPTHEPFYVHPDILIAKIMQYEERKKPVSIEDFIVACNRLLLSEVTTKTIEAAQKLTGAYAKAIQYYVGATDKITNPETNLPLWAQITRIKNPNGVFPEFETTMAGDYPSVIRPFYVDFEMGANSYGDSTWYSLTLEKNWNHVWNKAKEEPREFLFYNSAPSEKAFRTDVAAQLSLTPQYLEAHLCRYIPSSLSGNEVDGFEDCQYPLQFVLENNLTIYHSGWIYVAVCLLFEKPVSRNLAAEFIELSLNRGENLAYLADVVGRLIGLKVAPINRLIEYLDKPNERNIKLFQFHILEKCLLYFDAQKLPTNSKKIVAYHKEFVESLKING